MHQLTFLSKLANRRNLVYKPGTSPEGLPECYVYSSDMPDPMYRYAFARWWCKGPLVLWVMFNPTKRDTHGGSRRTLQRCIKWSRRWDGAGLIIANLFAYRHNDPKGLRRIHDPIGPENDAVLDSLGRFAKHSVVAWGGIDKRWYGRAAKVASLLTNPLCLRVTASGQPWHPLFVPDDAKPLPWSVV